MRLDIYLPPPAHRAEMFVETSGGRYKTAPSGWNIGFMFSGAYQMRAETGSL
ncbi:MAG: hypothetical protein WD625_02835 [Balneolales bacterium]